MVKSKLQDGVLSVILDDPHTNQSFSIQDAQHLLELASDTTVQFIILTSNSSVFCSGGNLRDYAHLEVKQDGIEVNQKIREYLQSFCMLPIPKLAMVTGDCFGGGLELISCCQWVYSTPQVFFGLWQRKLGLSFGWGGFERLSTKMSSHILKSWLLEADTKSAEWCLNHHLVDRIVPLHKTEDSIQQWVKQQRRLYQDSFKTIFQNIDANPSKTFEALWWSDYHQQELKKYYK